MKWSPKRAGSFHFSAARYLLSLGFCLTTAVSYGQTTPETARSEDVNRYCGIYAVYLAGRLMHQTPDLAELINAFPQVNTRGLSLTELSTLLGRTGLRSKIYKIGPADILRNPKGIFILFSRESPQAMGHYRVAKAQLNQILVLDPFANVESRLSPDIDAEWAVAVWRDPGDEPAVRTKFWYLSAALAAGGAVLLLRNTWMARAAR